MSSIRIVPWSNVCGDIMIMNSFRYSGNMGASVMVNERQLC